MLLLHYLILVYTIQVNSAFRALASPFIDVTHVTVLSVFLPFKLCMPVLITLTGLFCINIIIIIIRIK